MHCKLVIIIRFYTEKSRQKTNIPHGNCLCCSSVTDHKFETDGRAYEYIEAAGKGRSKRWTVWKDKLPMLA